MLRTMMQDGMAMNFCDYEDLTNLSHVKPIAVNEERMRRSINQIEEGSHSDWYGGFTSRKNAVATLESGWQQGGQRSEAMAQTLHGEVPAAESIRRRVKWGEDGETFCVDRGMMGEWDMAYSSTPLIRTSGSRILTLVGPVGGSANRSAEELFWNGVQLVVLTHLFEEAGYQCEVIGMISLAQQGVNNPSFITAKRAGEPLRIDQLASVFAHAGVFRTFCFELISLSRTPVDYGLGYCQYQPSIMQATVNKVAKAGLIAENAIVIGEAYTKDSAIANIRKMIAAVTGGANV